MSQRTAWRGENPHVFGDQRRRERRILCESKGETHGEEIHSPERLGFPCSDGGRCCGCGRFRGSETGRRLGAHAR